jgi:hypothetical protein
MSGFKSELVFGLDNFQRQKVLDSNNSLAQVILNIFFMRPGNLPSLPHIGINITSYLYKFEDELDAEGLKEKIYSQCSELIPYLDIGNIKIFVANYKGNGILMIAIPIIGGDNILYAFTKDSTGNVLFNYDFEANIMNENK